MWAAFHDECSYGLVRSIAVFVRFRCHQKNLFFTLISLMCKLSHHFRYFFGRKSFDIFIFLLTSFFSSDKYYFSVTFITSPFVQLTNAPKISFLFIYLFFLWKTCVGFFSHVISLRNYENPLLTMFRYFSSFSTHKNQQNKKNVAAILSLSLCSNTMKIFKNSAKSKKVFLVLVEKEFLSSTISLWEILKINFKESHEIFFADVLQTSGWLVQDQFNW